MYLLISPTHSRTNSQLEISIMNGDITDIFSGSWNSQVEVSISPILWWSTILYVSIIFNLYLVYLNLREGEVIAMSFHLQKISQEIQLEDGKLNRNRQKYWGSWKEKKKMTKKKRNQITRVAMKRNWEMSILIWIKYLDQCLWFCKFCYTIETRFIILN